MKRTTLLLVASVWLLPAGGAVLADHLDPVTEIVQTDLPASGPARLALKHEGERGPIDLPVPKPGPNPIFMPLSLEASFQATGAQAGLPLGALPGSHGMGMVDRIVDDERRLRKLIRRLDD